MIHTNYRGCKEWCDGGLPMSTTSDEATKMFDATLSQYVGFRDETSVGGMAKTMERMLSADPEFVMGRVIVNGLTVVGMGKSPRWDKQLRQSIDEMVRLAETRKITKRETKHVEAIKLLSDGYMYEATQVWEDILVDHPTDILALKQGQDAYYRLGKPVQMRDSIARVLPHWDASIPLYAYLPGFYAFGLCETDHWNEAEKSANKGIELIPTSSWATHVLAHVYEMQGRTQEGISHLSTTLDNWTDHSSAPLANHIFWHWAVFHIERGEYTAALDLFDSQVSECTVRQISVRDMAWLNSAGVTVGQERWEDVAEVCRPRLDEHTSVFNDCHLLMACLSAKKSSDVDHLIGSIKTYVMEVGTGTQHKLFETVGKAMTRSLVAYGEGRYSDAVRILNPHRYSIIDIGGSNAQRDVFKLFLINAAIRSNTPEHRRLARSLVIERKAYKPDSPMTDRLMERVMALHDN
ncbi:PREDICTED: tetratricopeptide repeat protein 38-like [Priapulus caudatus]|uniref:Tetratricopeptide repeat protein 38 n=1 Tax=Priapulus caudatus TaxID=37621 RepID=A0ABM1EDT4_PRICU|nr:PREDICTED: tetratricopeptide repeat protein 38-like [Priapulus caudatus]